MRRICGGIAASPPANAQYFPDRAVDRPVDLQYWIARLRGDRRIEGRIGRIVQVPTLVTDAVTLGEHLGEEIPAALPLISKTRRPESSGRKNRRVLP